VPPPLLPLLLLLLLLLGLVDEVGLLAEPVDLIADPLAETTHHRPPKRFWPWPDVMPAEVSPL
jgi:hypothetical protein